MQKPIELPCLQQLAKMILQGPVLLCNVSLILMVMVIDTLVPPRGVPTHFARPLKVRLIPNLLKYLIHWLFKQRVDRLSSRGRCLISELPSGAITLVSPSLSISLLQEHFHLAVSLNLVFLHPLILIDAIHQLAHVWGRLHHQRLPQFVLRREPYLKGPHGHIFKVSINLIISFLIPIRLCLESLSFPHHHR